jgi:ABC-2 type transport system ATP-binding protein
MAIIELENLTKHFKVLNHREGLIGSIRDLVSTDYRLVKAVDGISLKINEGEIVGFIGPNGAGKSTTIKMMTGILKPSSGTLLVMGRVPYLNRQKNAQIIGVVIGQRPQLWWDLPVIESFKLLREIYRVPQDVFQAKLDLYNHLVGLNTLFDRTVRTLSLGQRMLCDITAAFLHDPDVVFLDEPTIGLDISIKSKIRALISELNAKHNTTIILTTHDIGDIEALCQRVVIIDKGKIIFDDAMQKVNTLFGAYRTLRLQLAPGKEDCQPALMAGLTGAFAPGEGHSLPVAVTAAENGWVEVVIDQAQVALRDVLNFAMTQYPIHDIQIAEIATENVIKKIYEGNRI